MGQGIRSKHNGIEIYINFKGKRHSRFLNKPWNKTNCAEARGIRRRLLDDLRDGKITGDNPTFRDLAQEYLDSIRRRGLSPTVIRKSPRTINIKRLPADELITST